MQKFINILKNQKGQALLIIVLVIATAVVALLFYSNQTIEERGGEAETSGGFFSNLNPFKGGPQTTPPYVTPVGEEETNTEIPVDETEKKILIKEHVSHEHLLKNSGGTKNK